MGDGGRGDRRGRRTEPARTGSFDKFASCNLGHSHPPWGVEADCLGSELLSCSHNRQARLQHSCASEHPKLPGSIEPFSSVVNRTFVAEKVGEPSNRELPPFLGTLLVDFYAR